MHINALEVFFTVNCMLVIACKACLLLHVKHLSYCMIAIQDNSPPLPAPSLHPGNHPIIAC